MLQVEFVVQHVVELVEVFPEVYEVRAKAPAHVCVLLYFLLAVLALMPHEVMHEYDLDHHEEGELLLLLQLFLNKSGDYTRVHSRPKLVQREGQQHDHPVIREHEDVVERGQHLHII